MELEIIETAIRADPDQLFRFLRDPSLELRISAFDAFRHMLCNSDPIAIRSIADFVAVLKIELIPNLADEADVDKRGALAHVARGIAVIARAIDKPEAFIPIIPLTVELLKHPYPGVKAALMGALGELYRANPDELDDHATNRLLRFFDNSDPEVLAATASAWGNIALGNPDSGLQALSPIYRLLANEHPRVRAEAAGFFRSLASESGEECSIALPQLREMRDSDPDDTVRERAGAAVQAISNTIGEAGLSE